MPASGRRRKNAYEEHTHLAIHVEHYQARVGASVNHHAYAPQYGWNLDEDDPVYEFNNQLIITGVSVCPPERAGGAYDLTIYSTGARSHRLNDTLKAILARDKHERQFTLQFRVRR